MTADRASAYTTVLGLLDALGPAKLHADEQAVVREAADALFFTSDLDGDDEARKALDAFDTVIDGLVENERLTRETAEALADAVEACAPPVHMAA